MIMKMESRKNTGLILVLIMCFALSSQAQLYKFAVMKYNGGGDWYANPTSVPNLIKFCNQNLKTSINPEPDVVAVSSPEIFNYPFIHMTGHGNVIFSQADAENLRNYLIGGGFLHIDDNYGMDKFIRPELKKVFPELELTELPPSHPIYRNKYIFKNGLPKVHEHDNKPAQGFGLIYKGRLVLYYTYETDLGDGWEDADVHKDSEEKRRTSLQMGANLVQYVLSGSLEP
jgi:hypothetical protein